MGKYQDIVQIPVKLLTLNDYKPGLSWSSRTDASMTTGYLCVGDDSKFRTSLLAAVQRLARELVVLRTVERNGGRVWCRGNRRQDLQMEEPKSANWCKLFCICRPLVWQGTSGSASPCGPPHPHHLKGEARKGENFLVMPRSAQFNAERGQDAVFDKNNKR